MADITGMLQAAAGNVGGEEAGYQISRSLRFNSADSAYLSRTPASAGNRKTWTWSGWVKRSKLGSQQPFFSARQVDDSNDCFISFESDDTLRLIEINAAVHIFKWQTTQVFRDVSSWYHLVIALDTTQATSTDRLAMYVNGVKITSYSTQTTPAQNTDLEVNTALPHAIGRRIASTTYFNGYLADIHFVDGQALTPSDFGETDATTGVWKPKEYTGTYGTNGFHLDFSDNTSTTALGYDAAGSNNWTANNFSVTAGTGNDSLVDTPTPYGTDTGAGGEVRGNYCTMNPLKSGLLLSNGNLSVTSSAGYACAIGTIGVSSGKWYWEVLINTTVNANGVGIGDSSTDTTTYLGKGNSLTYTAIGTIYGPGDTTTQTGLATFGSGDIIGVGLDMDANEVKFYKNNSLVTTVTGLSTTEWFPALSDDSSGSQPSIDLNFGQRPFAYTAPSGFKALCTQNLPEGTITTSGTFTGNGSTDGPFVYLNGVPTAMTIDGNAVTFGTHADKLANGFKVRSSSASYNANATSMSYTISTTGAKFKYANAQPNP